MAGVSEPSTAVHNGAVDVRLLTSDERSNLAVDLPKWRTEGETLRRRYSFASFVDAMAFVSAMVEPSESMNHHPTWTNTYNRVEVQLTTHDMGGLSTLDIEWAEIADRVAERLPQQR
jgi:4a-hydroxytetrahydrobiopterin dehydratase